MKLRSIKIFAAAALLFTVLAWQGCDKDDPKGPECTIPNADLSYTKNIQGIVNQYCIGCHAPGTGVVGAVGDYRNYEGLKVYLDNGKVLDRVVIDKDMPQGGGMSQAQRDSINCWIAAGYPK
jgi:mono/diheme cytochrome c family protein